MKQRATRISGVLAAVVFTMLIAAETALAVEVEVPVEVTDDVTRVHVAKLDSATHEFVPGATMQILEKDTGQVVDEWTTGTEVHKNEMQLDVGVVYVLHEAQAPAGYTAVADVEFTIPEVEGEALDLQEREGEVELSGAYLLNVYDPPTSTETEVVRYEDRRGQDTVIQGQGTPSTGDRFPLVPMVAVLVVVAAVAVLVAVFARRKAKN